MINKEKDLENLHSELTQKLLDKIRSPEVTASELNVARQFLKDNNIDALPVKDSTLAKLAENLPFSEEDLKAVAEDVKH